jgi:hypothetical protein
MPKREDETFRNIYGHGPNCNCPICVRLRHYKSLGKPVDEEEWDWVKISGDCEYCNHKGSKMLNKKDNKIGCWNKHCRKYYEYL